MQDILFPKSEVKIISPQKDGAHYFFGYYDLQPYDTTGRYHLAHQVDFMDRLPDKNDSAQIGVIDTQTSKFERVAETSAWNFQQGAMLRWYDKDSILYNIRKKDGFGCVIKNIRTGESREYPLPVASVSPESGYSLSINFSRIYDFRAGYGYSDVPDPFYDENAPQKDGVFLQNMRTGEAKLLISYRQLVETFPEPPFTTGKILVNHITFNPSGTKFVFLLRTFPTDEKMWATQLLCSDLQGNLTRLTHFQFNSHYSWMDDSHLLIVTDWQRDGWGLDQFDVEKNTCELLEIPELKGRDIHCLYSPDRKYILGDGYPDAQQYRPLFLFHTETKEFFPLVYSKSLGDSIWDARSDLHARWSPDGRKISFDATHTGSRTICEMDMSKILQK